MHKYALPPLGHLGRKERQTGPAGLLTTSSYSDVYVCHSSRSGSDLLFDILYVSGLARVALCTYLLRVLVSVLVMYPASLGSVLPPLWVHSEVLVSSWLVDCPWDWRGSTGPARLSGGRVSPML